MIDEKKLIKELSKNSVFEKITNAEGKNVFEIIKTQPQVGCWIPVSERLPEQTQDEYYPISLVTLDNGDVCLGVYRYDDKEWYTRMSEGETVYTKDHKVIAWMPLPEPYKESEK